MQRPVGNDFFGWIAYLLDSYGSLFLQGAGYTMLIAISGTVLGFLLGPEMKELIRHVRQLGMPVLHF
mgnify:CR=1 FL=1